MDHIWDSFQDKTGETQHVTRSLGSEREHSWEHSGTYQRNKNIALWTKRKIIASPPGSRRDVKLFTGLIPAAGSHTRFGKGGGSIPKPTWSWFLTCLIPICLGNLSRILGWLWVPQKQQNHTLCMVVIPIISIGFCSEWMSRYIGMYASTPRSKLWSSGFNAEDRIWKTHSVYFPLAIFWGTFTRAQSVKVQEAEKRILTLRAALAIRFGHLPVHLASFLIEAFQHLAEFLRFQATMTEFHVLPVQLESGACIFNAIVRLTLNLEICGKQERLCISQGQPYLLPNPYCSRKRANNLYPQRQGWLARAKNFSSCCQVLERNPACTSWY